MNHFSHTCPYCFSSIEFDRSDSEVSIMRCPSCGFLLKLSAHGASISSVKAYKCDSCNKISLYDSSPEKAVCLNCGNKCSNFTGDELADEEIIYQKEDAKNKKKRKRKDNKLRRLASGWQNSLKGKWKKLSKKSRRAVRTGVAAAIALFIGYQFFNRPEAIASTKAYADMQNVWTEFRTKNPYNLQIEGLKKYDDNSYVVIISEPSEFVTENRLASFFDDYNCAYSVCKRQLGYDGWVKDFVVCFNDLEEKDIPKFTKKLSKLLYNTDYKAHLYDLSNIPEYVAFSDQDLNLQVSAPELRQWMINDKEPLVNPKDTTETFTLPDLMHGGKKGIYFSQKPGFVVWILEKGEQKKSRFREQARMFSLDSDVILGAVADERQVAIIGRERSISSFELPPMRAETLQMLAGAVEEELGQSYQRTSMFAGKMKGGHDFAPIALSPQLWHTEYGSILNVTDQMLKSWSENGIVEYDEFNHAKPVDWPFDNGAHIDVNSNRMTYNWNTKGLGYVINYDDYSVYSLNRTGSLPVSYIPDEALGGVSNEEFFSAEEKAYDFFSNLSSPQLVKVVQYLAMYQIFHNFGISVDAEEIDVENNASIPPALVEEARNTLESLCDLNYGKRVMLADSIDPAITIESYSDFNENSDKPYFLMPGGLVASVPDESVRNQESLAKYYLLISRLDKVGALIKNVRGDTALISSLAENIAGSLGNVRYVQYANPNMDPKKIFKEMNRIRKIRNGQLKDPMAFDPEEYEVQLPKFNSKKEEVEYITETIDKSGGELQTYSYWVNHKKPEEYLQSFLECNANRSKEWIKCPTVVMSVVTTDSLETSGGHNLSAGISVFNVNRNLKKGQTVRKGSGKELKALEISAADAMARAGDPSYIRRVVKLNRTDLNGEDTPLKSRQEVAGVTENRSERGFNTKDHLVISRQGAEYTINGKKTGASVADLVSEAAASIDNGQSHTSVTLEFKNLCEDECMAIVGRFGEVRLKKGGTLGCIPCEALDVNNIVTENLSNGNVRVKIAVKPSAVQTLLESDEWGFRTTADSPDHTVWSRIRQYFMIFEVPKAKVEKFMTILLSYVNDNYRFRRFEFKQRSKENGIEIKEEIDALQVAKNKNNNYVLEDEEKRVA